MQLDAVEARLPARARRASANRPGSTARQLADVRQLHVGDALAVAGIAAPRARARESTSRRSLVVARAPASRSRTARVVDAPCAPSARAVRVA